MAGHETSAGVIKYTLYALSKDQERQDKLRAELSATGFSATCGIGGREPTYDELTDSKTLPYLDAVVKEACAIIHSILSGGLVVDFEFFAVRLTRDGPRTLIP